MSTTVQVTIWAEVQLGGGKAIQVGRKVTSDPGDGAEDVQRAITLALRLINEDVKGLLP